VKNSMFRFPRLSHQREKQKKEEEERESKRIFSGMLMLVSCVRFFVRDVRKR
jgi:hypothetical protein